MLADFLLSNETPIFIGGYNTYYKPDNFCEGLRTQSVKGLLRYWLRCYLAGAGINVSEINNKTCELLGGKIGETFFASKIQIKSYLINDKPSVFYEKNIPRINLLLLGRKQKLDCAQFLKARLSLYERKGVILNENDKGLIVGTLLTSLLLSGLGKMARRGFGTFRVDVWEDGTKLFYDDITNIFSADSTDEDRKKSIIRIIEKTKRNIMEEKPFSDIPPIHAIHKKYFKLIYISMRKEPKHVINDLQNFTLRPKRAKVLFGDFKKDDEITKKHLAWFLGLPRSPRETGYIIKDDDVQRRPSPLFFSVHRNFALVSLFLSKDWPRNLTWKGAKKEEPLNITVNEIQKAYDITFNLLIQYLDKLNYEWTVIYGES
ncbi:MAG: hypothetical protein QXL51_06145 [Candidatus Aenigmatarchaeota archaeon]